MSSDIGEEPAAGPPVQEGHSTPAPPPSQGHGSPRYWRAYTEVLKTHVAALQDLNKTLKERTEAEALWHDRLLEELVQQRTSICATIREVCGLPASVPGTAPPARHDPAPTNHPSPPPPLSPFAPSSPPDPPVPQPSSPPALLDPSAPPLSCPAFCQSPHPTPRPWWSPHVRWQELASREAPSLLNPLPPPGSKPPPPSRF